MEKNIRKIRQEDLQDIVEIYNYEIENDTNTFDTESKDVNDRLKWMNDHNNENPIFVYVTDKKVVAYSSLSKFNNKKAYDISAELSLYVNKDYRKKGIGKELLDYTIKYAKECTNLKTIISLITSNNLVSIKLHNEFNFTYAGTIKKVGIKFNKELDIDYYYLNIK